MSFLSKLGLVESQTNDLVPEVPAPLPAVEVSPDIDVSELIAEIYTDNDLPQQSIFTIQAYLETLPAEMTTEKKQSSISGILAVSGIRAADLLVDGERRLGLLRAALDKIESDRAAENEAAAQDIEALKKAIEQAQKRIAENMAYAQESRAVISAELDRINSLLHFVGGMREETRS